MHFFYKITEVASNLGGGYAIFTLIAWLYCKFQAMKTKSTYTMDNFAFDFWGGSRDEGYFVLFKWIYIIAMIATVVLIFFTNELGDRVFIAIKLIALAVALFAVAKN